MQAFARRAKATSDRKKAIQFIAEQSVGVATSQLDEVESQPIFLSISRRSAGLDASLERNRSSHAHLLW
ncbi:hypothetical protein [Rhizobium laguerreae]|uniref:hypothetical protein n=1 Tax=Rhizobium laguerreae TaxID=1076926 RepID=UPI0021B0AD2A|nr:hypothetical protein [Rhizobium laguerreae]